MFLIFTTVEQIHQEETGYVSSNRELTLGLTCYYGHNLSTQIMPLDQCKSFSVCLDGDLGWNPAQFVMVQEISPIPHIQAATSVQTSFWSHSGAFYGAQEGVLRQTKTVSDFFTSGNNRTIYFFKSFVLSTSNQNRKIRISGFPSLHSSGQFKNHMAYSTFKILHPFLCTSIAAVIARGIYIKAQESLSVLFPLVIHSTNHSRQLISLKANYSIHIIPLSKLFHLQCISYLSSHFYHPLRYFLCSSYNDFFIVLFHRCKAFYYLAIEFPTLEYPALSPLPGHNHGGHSLTITS